MTQYVYVDLTNGIIDSFPCTIEEMQPIYENFYNERFHIEHYELIKVEDVPYACTYLVKEGYD